MITSWKPTFHGAKKSLKAAAKFPYIEYIMLDRSVCRVIKIWHYSNTATASSLLKRERTCMYYYKVHN